MGGRKGQRPSGGGQARKLAFNTLLDIIHMGISHLSTANGVIQRGGFRHRLLG